MRVVASCGAGFLLAVLWFDLMFDVQVRGQGPMLPAGVRDSIAAYYRRVTTTSAPMSRLIALAMFVTLGALIGEIVRDAAPMWASIPSLFLVACAVGLAAGRTVPAAKRLGSQVDSPQDQDVLARSIFRDHLAGFVAIALTVMLQIASA